jgi:hypothetical protein
VSAHERLDEYRKCGDNWTIKNTSREAEDGEKQSYRYVDV